MSEETKCICGAKLKYADKGKCSYCGTPTEEPKWKKQIEVEEGITELHSLINECLKSEEPKRVWITLLDNGGYRVYRNGKCIHANNSDSEGLTELILELIIDTKCKKIIFEE